MSTQKIFFIAGLGVAILGVLVFWVFPGKIILPQSLELFGWSFRWYGLILALAVLSAYYLATLRAGKFGFTKTQLDSLSLYLVVGGFIGARLYHVFTELAYYLAHPIEMLFVWHGGLGIFGAVIGGLLGLWLYTTVNSRSQSFLKLLDWLVPSLVLGQIIGRFGNLINYEAYGSPTGLPWKMYVPSGFRLQAWQEFSYFHPLFLYEAMGSLLILLVLINLPRFTQRFKIPQFSGQSFVFWLVLYGLLRFLTESFRLDSQIIFGLKQNLLVAGLLILCGVSILVYKKFYSRNESQ